MRFRIFAFLLSAFAVSAHAAESTDSNNASFKMEGEASLMSNYVEYGLTHTDKDPALQGKYLFNFGPQFRMGVWGSNIAYEGSDTHFLLRINADIVVTFSKDSSMTIKVMDEHFFKPETRNGMISGLHFNFYGYGIRYEQINNFEGTEEAATSYAFTKTWDVWQTWHWENLIGYMMLDSSTLTNYFWLESFLGTKPGYLLYQGGISFNSNPSQFHGEGDLAIVFKATANF